MEDKEIINIFLKMQESLENMENSIKDIERTANSFFFFYIAVPLLILLILFAIVNFAHISLFEIFWRIFSNTN